MSIIIKKLTKENVHQISQIDRTETFETWLKVNDKGSLDVRMKKPTHIKKWNSEQLSHYINKTSHELDNEGVFIGALDEEKLVGFTLLAQEFLNDEKEMQLIFLYVSISHRRKGIASRLLSAASESAKEKGAKSLYISATSSESTVNFYLNQGCTLAKNINKELQDLEPWDIQLIKDL